MNGAARWLPVVGVTLAASLFAWLNRGERVVVDVGVATFYRAPFTVVFFLAFLAGMVSMLLLGLRHDLRVRRELQARGLVSAPPHRSAPAPADAPPFDPFSGPVPAGESAAIRVVRPPAAGAEALRTGSAEAVHTRRPSAETLPPPPNSPPVPDLRDADT